MSAKFQQLLSLFKLAAECGYYVLINPASGVDQRGPYLQKVRLTFKTHKLSIP